METELKSKELFEDGSGEAGICPVCESETLAYGEMRTDATGNIYPWKCNNCGAEGEETYEVTFTGHYNKN